LDSCASFRTGNLYALFARFSETAVIIEDNQLGQTIIFFARKEPPRFCFGVVANRGGPWIVVSSSGSA
jgi:hypothetical protein